MNHYIILDICIFPSPYSLFTDAILFFVIIFLSKIW